MNQFDTIHLIWRASKSKPRIKVGILYLTKDNKVDFKYRNLKKEKSYKEFKGYPGLDIKITEHKDVLDLFSKRLIDTKRTDSKELLKFWGIDLNEKNNKVYILVMTQGLTSIDNFEFLAEFKVQKGLNFVTNIAALSHSKFDLNKLKEGDILNFKKVNHEHDSHAVEVLIQDEHIGYIKQVHNKVFHQAGAENLIISVKKIINTPEDKELFVSVYYKA